MIRYVVFSFPESRANTRIPSYWTRHWVLVCIKAIPGQRAQGNEDIMTVMTIILFTPILDITSRIMISYSCLIGETARLAGPRVDKKFSILSFVLSPLYKNVNHLAMPYLFCCATSCDRWEFQVKKVENTFRKGRPTNNKVLCIILSK